jgi:hypothetical protein
MQKYFVTNIAQQNTKKNQRLHQMQPSGTPKQKQNNEKNINNKTQTRKEKRKKKLAS